MILVNVCSSYFGLPVISFFFYLFKVSKYHDNKNVNTISFCIIHRLVELLFYLNFVVCVFMFELIVPETPEYLFPNLNFGRSVRTLNILVPIGTQNKCNSFFFLCSWSRSMRNRLSSSINLY